MELKSIIRTLKMQKGRYAKNPNAESEKKTIDNLVTKMGGKLEAIAKLNEAGETELKDYVKSVLGLIKVEASEAPVQPTETPKKVGRPKKNTEIAFDKNKVVYEIDSVKKTCKKVFHDLAEINFDDLDIPEINLSTYKNYLKDKFPDEQVTYKRGKIMFRDYRISLTVENGFMIEDTRKRYEVVETPWEGIPTPAELGDWFRHPEKKELSDAEKIQEHIAAVEAGKRIEYEKKRKRELAMEAADKKSDEVDYEACRKNVLMKIADIRAKVAPSFDPEDFPKMIPFRRWRKQCKSLLTRWKNKEIRYAKFLNELEKITVAETFVIEEKNHRSAFKGSMLPEHSEVGNLVGDKLEVDGKLVDAVPFLLDYLLHYEPRAMSQIMKFAKGDIDEKELIENPIQVDWKEEYKKKLLPNTAHNARVITCVFEACGIAAPQDLLYKSELKPGDTILLMLDGKMVRRTVASTEKGVTLGREVGLLKLDKWILAPKKD